MNNHQNHALHSLDNFYQTSFRTTRAGLIEYHQLSKNQNSVNHPIYAKVSKSLIWQKIEFLLITPIYAKVSYELFIRLP